MPSGGSRAGAGRKAKSEKFVRPIDAAEKQIADRLVRKDKLPGLVDNLLFLADGHYTEVTETWEPAGMLTTGAGLATMPAFPDLPPEQLVLVKSVKTVAAPDRTANQYLIDRIVGKTVAPVEVSGTGGEPIVFSLRLGDAEPTG
jgi:hypothetical protein